MKLLIPVAALAILAVLVVGCYNDAGWYIPQMPQTR